LACFYSLLVLLLSLCLVAKKYIIRSIIILISLFLLCLNNWKLTLGDNISSSNKVIDMLKFLVLLGASDIIFITNKELGITDTITPR
jgi:hypothetical protein